MMYSQTAAISIGMDVIRDAIIAHVLLVQGVNNIVKIVGSPAAGRILAVDMVINAQFHATHCYPEGFFVNEIESKFGYAL